MTRTGQVDKVTSRLEFENKGNSEEYKVQAICDSAVYTKESDSGHYLLGLYYSVSIKGYFEEENTWEPVLVVLHLRKLNSTFHCDHPEKPIATSPPIDSALPMARPIAKLKAETSSTKQKRGRPAKANDTSKRAKKS